MNWIDWRLEFNGTYPQRLLSGINYIVIHHSGVDVDSTAESIKTYHESLGWPGIGYHFLVHWDGRVEYVGDVGTLRYNVSGRNAEVIGICIPGDWSLRPPPKAALEALKETVKDIRELMGRNVPTCGHKDLAATSCPGDTFYSWYVEDKVKERVLALYGHIWGGAGVIIKGSRSLIVREAAQTIKDCIVQAKEAQGWNEPS